MSIYHQFIHTYLSALMMQRTAFVSFLRHFFSRFLHPHSYKHKRSSKQNSQRAKNVPCQEMAFFSALSCHKFPSSSFSCFDQHVIMLPFFSFYTQGEKENTGLVEKAERKVSWDWQKRRQQQKDWRFTSAPHRVRAPLRESTQLTGAFFFFWCRLDGNFQPLDKGTSVRVPYCRKGTHLGMNSVINEAPWLNRGHGKRDSKRCCFFFSELRRQTQQNERTTKTVFFLSPRRALAIS